ncbi:MAG: tRNA epoxyqueuosine(34) reductase QueG [Nitrospirae bacterium]|nr:MAG: tRNA epoxyqueuosine(34) reductase QueG [Nitrospirota bacterium]
MPSSADHPGIPQSEVPLLSNRSALTAAIKRAAQQLGFDAIGIATIPAHESSPQPSQTDRPAPPHQASIWYQHLLEKLLSWLTQGFHGTMHWMSRDPERRANPTAVLPGCRSIICVGMNYWTDHQPDERPGNGRIARYAWGEDYHRVVTRRLKRLERMIQTIAPQAQTRSYVDTGPIMEKAWAQQAGLGWIGKHTNLVSPQFGSWLVLGEILTTLELEPDEPATDLCGSCSLCLRACPTQAFPEPYQLDATKCLSYLTIEFRGTEENIPAELRKQIGNHIFGCDDCLDVCPYNVYATPTQEPAFQPSSLTLSPNLAQLAHLDEETFTMLFRKSPIRRAKFHGFLRNVRLAQRASGQK